jgi:hypothetical protein
LSIFFKTCRRKQQRAPNSLSSSNFCSLIPKDDDELAPLVIFFCFVYVHQEKMTTSANSSLSFLFCLYAPKENDDELILVIIFFCFVYVHPKKMTTNVRSSSSFFVLPMCTQRRRRQANAHHCFFCFVYVHP